MIFKRLVEQIATSPSFKSFLEKVYQNKSFSAAGLSEGLFPFAVTEIANNFNKNLLIIVKEKDLGIWEELSSLLGDKVLIFPNWDIYPYEHRLPSPRQSALRLKTLITLNRKETQSNNVVITTPKALLEPTYSPSTLPLFCVRLKVGQKVDIEQLADQLDSLGYEHSGLVEFLGTYAVRGGIVDFFSFAHNNPIRVEFYGDKIEGIRSFSALSQRSLESLDEAVILPVHEFVRDFWFRGDFDEKEEIVAEFKRSISKKKKEELFRRLSIDRAFPGFHWFSPYFSPTKSSLLEYFTQASTLIFLPSKEEVQEQFETYFQEADKFYAQEVETLREMRSHPGGAFECNIARASASAQPDLHSALLGHALPGV